jgi:iron complex outermembrane receptor protein
MKSNRSVLLTGLSLTALSLAAAPHALAQSVPTDDAPSTEVVVTGSRAAPRSRLDSIAPVDVVSNAAITRTGNTELAQSLSEIVPSINFPRPTLTDGTDTVRPATLRGLAPDETLVLVNSKRRQSSALVNLNGSIGRGSSGVDLNTIPTGAIGTIEILRDGAAAQYGSDAIAGVINIRMRQADHGGEISISSGQYDTDVNYRNQATTFGGGSVPTSDHYIDGQTTTISGWTGLKLFDTGFLTLTGESKIQSHTTRAGPDSREQYPLVGGQPDPRETSANRINAWYGDPKVKQYSFFANAGYDTSNGNHLYGWGSFQSRDVLNGANFRRALQSNTSPAADILSVYPDGFLPKIEGQTYDASGAIGDGFKALGWDWDASVVYGFNRLEYGVRDSLNVSLGPTSPHSFDAGALQYQQVVGNLGATHQYQFAHFKEVNVAFGTELRYEAFKEEAGEAASYVNGGYVPLTVALAGVGSQGFPGYAPANATDQNRTEESAYLDIEAKPIDALSVDGAVRFEHYSDFGSEVTGKLAARYDFSPMFALRGAVSTGFRAPSLMQEYFTAVSTNFINGVPVQVSTLSANSATAKLIGATPLKAEKSDNYSGGGVFRYGAFSLTVDAYQIKLKDRITLTENLTAANVIALFGTGSGIGGARFFTNGVDTTTNGVEAVATYRWRPKFVDIGSFNFTLSGSHNETKLNKLPTNNVLSALSPAPLLVAHVNAETFTDGQPKYKGSFVTDWTDGIFSTTLKATYYGKLIQPGTTAALDLPLASATLVDLEFRVRPTDHFTFSLGVDNLFDKYPTGVPANLNPNGVAAWPEYSPFGFQGRYLYARATFSW